MKALVVLVHYFAEEANPQHSSVDGTRRDERTQVVQRVIRGHRGTFGPASTIRYPETAYVVDMACPVDVDIRILSVRGHSLIDDRFQSRFGIWQTNCLLKNPRTLGFEAYQIFEKFADRYDWFIYSEDDILVRDPLLFDKLAWFNQTFGDGRVLAPNRFEWSDRGRTQKTYVDHDLNDGLSARLVSAVPDEEWLKASPLGTETTFRRANNPHSGFFAVTASQLAYWMSRPHWRERDMSFISPLESAATLGLTKTFSVYKPYGLSAPFLEVEHLDNRFSEMSVPLTWAPSSVEAPI